MLVVWVTGSEQLHREIKHQLFKWMAASSLSAAVSHGLAWLSLQQFAEQERQDSCFHHGGRKMCKTKDTQIQDLTKTQSWGLQNTTQIHQGSFTPTKLHKVQAWYQLMILKNPTNDLLLQSYEENLAEQ